MREEKAKVVVCILVVAGLLGLWTLATAGDLQPSGSPAPTMRTLDEIYGAAADGSQREGYIGHFILSGGSDVNCFTVQAGKQFVLTKVVFRYDGSTWKRQASITADDDFLTGFPYFRSYTDEYGFTQSFADFADGCVVVDADKVVKVVNNESSDLYAMVVGYFCDVP